MPHVAEHAADHDGVSPDPRTRIIERSCVSAVEAKLCFWSRLWNDFACFADTDVRCFEVSLFSILASGYRSASRALLPNGSEVYGGPRRRLLDESARCGISRQGVE